MKLGLCGRRHRGLAVSALDPGRSHAVSFFARRSGRTLGAGGFFFNRSGSEQYQHLSASHSLNDPQSGQVHSEGEGFQGGRGFLHASLQSASSAEPSFVLGVPR